MLDFPPRLLACQAFIDMRSLILPLVLVFSLTACGYRTPLTLPKPQTKPSANAPAPGEKP